VPPWFCGKWKCDFGAWGYPPGPELCVFEGAGDWGAESQALPSMFFHLLKCHPSRQGGCPTPVWVGPMGRGRPIVIPAGGRLFRKGPGAFVLLALRSWAHRQRASFFSKPSFLRVSVLSGAARQRPLSFDAKRKGEEKRRGFEGTTGPPTTKGPFGPLGTPPRREVLLISADKGNTGTKRNGKNSCRLLVSIFESLFTRMRDKYVFITFHALTLLRQSSRPTPAWAAP